MQQQDRQQNKGISRRQMLVATGALAAGATLAHLGGMMQPARAKGSSAEQWPWPYEKLDPAATAAIAYEEWYRVFCGAAVINSVFSQLREKVGEPYLSFPADSFVFLEGGMTGWGMTCGSNAGAAIVANCIIGPRTAGGHEGHLITTELFEWYSDAMLPIHVPEKPKVATDIVQTSSDSPLCHLSVGRWMEASGFPITSAERKDRCARVAASVAYHLVELLNQWHDGTYQAAGTHSPVKEFGITAQMNCMDCHGTNVPEPPI